MLTWLCLPLWSSATRSPSLNPWNLQWPVVGAGSLHSEPRTKVRATIAALSFDSAVLKMGVQCPLEQYLVSAREGHQQWFPIYKVNACRRRNWHTLGNHGIPYCLASWWGLILPFHIPLPLESGMQTFVILPHVIWLRDLQVDLQVGFNRAKEEMGQLGAVSHLTTSPWKENPGVEVRRPELRFHLGSGHMVGT